MTKRQRRDRKVAMLLMTVVIVFFSCNSIRISLNIYEVIHLASYGNLTLDWPVWTQILTSSSNFLQVLNSSINIIIYCWKDDKFRIVLFQMLKLHRPMREQSNGKISPANTSLNSQV